MPTDLDSRIAELTHRRATHPEAIGDAWATRTRRPLLPDDGRLLIVAADHPARGALAVAGHARAMSSRRGLLHRLATALAHPDVDGVLGTADLLDDLLLLGLLDGKLAIGSMNRGGLAGASYELDDRFTGYSASALARQGLDGGKMLTRISLADPACVSVLHAASQAVTDLAAHRLPALIEPFWSGRDETGQLCNFLDPDSVIRSVHVAAGLGSTSAYTWLKLPVVPDMERVLDATTLPVLLLGGDPGVPGATTYDDWAAALHHHHVRGLVVGRALLYPGDDDVAAAVARAAALVHPRSDRPLGDIPPDPAAPTQVTPEGHGGMA
ncbi:hypothetical protein KEM60_01442 [Austwickia sp. TVS 96-490-7B]|uniref:Cgl0159 family (beta/alpha)8-fold protein n=1 Tax=Austwickia sp. TVS 96-490-7B TaxID=2830843 RepID=UPI001D20DA4C|nr:deoxyribose-phosphate aldolase [Austwickia sp. TVS 96-490-7B]MBW3085245.1 hypothetical protein [Austwickia sp. TVS 96-490-7B]